MFNFSREEQLRRQMFTLRADRRVGTYLRYYHKIYRSLTPTCHLVNLELLLFNKTIITYRHNIYIEPRNYILSNNLDIIVLKDVEFVIFLWLTICNA